MLPRATRLQPLLALSLAILTACAPATRTATSPSPPQPTVDINDDGDPTTKTEAEAEAKLEAETTESNSVEQTSQSFEEAGDANCEKLEDATTKQERDAIIDCRLYAPVDFDEPNTLHLHTEAAVYVNAPPDESGSSLSRVFDTMADRYEYAEHHGVPLDSGRLSPVERVIDLCVSTIVGTAHPRLVVTATSIYIRKGPGKFGKKHRGILREGDIVYFCGGHKGLTKPDPAEVPWYWIDYDGACDRSKPKLWIASQEVENGEHFWLVRWHDYNMSHAHRRKRRARAQNLTDEEKRWKGRIRGAAGKQTLPLNPYGSGDPPDWLKLLIACFVGVSVARIGASKTKSMARDVLKQEVGSTARSGLARQVGATIAGTAPMKSTNTRIGVLAGCVTAFALEGPAFTDIAGGTIVCFGTTTLLNLKQDWDKHKATQRRKQSRNKTSALEFDTFTSTEDPWVPA